MLKLIHQYPLQYLYPNFVVGLRIFFTRLVITCERSFSELKIINNYLRSTIGQIRFLVEKSAQSSFIIVMLFLFTYTSIGMTIKMNIIRQQKTFYHDFQRVKKLPTLLLFDWNWKNRWRGDTRGNIWNNSVKKIVKMFKCLVEKP